MQLILLAVLGMPPLIAQGEKELLPEADIRTEQEEEELNEAEKELRDTIRARGQELIELLKQVQDAASAAKHAARIRDLLLWEPDAAAMEQADEELLAVEFMESFEIISTELSRLAEQQFYGEKTLLELMQYFEHEQLQETP